MCCMFSSTSSLFPCEVEIDVGADSKGHATLSCSNCHIYVKHLGITRHGGASWLYDLFHDKLSDIIKSHLNDEVRLINNCHTDSNMYSRAC